jgi:hypothetical protein
MPTATTKALPKTTPTATTKASSKIPGTTHDAFLRDRLTALADNTALTSDLAHRKGTTLGPDLGGTYVLKTSRIPSMHKIMMQVVAKFDGHAELQMQFSTLPDYMALWIRISSNTYLIISNNISLDNLGMANPRKQVYKHGSIE